MEQEGRRTKREKGEREGQETREIREMGLYLLKWEFNTDTQTCSLRLLARLQTGQELS